MNMGEIRNPHRIYPGPGALSRQDRRPRPPEHAPRRPSGADGGTIKLSPRTRFESLSGMALPTLNPSLIEPFLSEPIMVDEDTLRTAPRIVAGNDSRVLLARGDRAYARGRRQLAAGRNGRPDPDLPRLPQRDAAEGPRHRRNPRLRGAVPRQGPAAAQRDRSQAEMVGRQGSRRAWCPRPSTSWRRSEEMRAGDRLLPEPPRQLLSYVPRAPEQADRRRPHRLGLRQRGAVRGAEPGGGDQQGHARRHRERPRAGHPQERRDHRRQAPAAGKETLKLPNERIGLLMVFRPFEKVSYALVLEINDAPQASATCWSTPDAARRRLRVEREELASWLRLTLTPGIGNTAARRLLAAFGLPADVFAQSPAALRAGRDARRRREALLREPAELRGTARPDPRMAARRRSHGATRRILTLGDAGYPGLAARNGRPAADALPAGRAGARSDAARPQHRHGRQPQSHAAGRVERARLRARFRRGRDHGGVGAGARRRRRGPRRRARGAPATRAAWRRWRWSARDWTASTRPGTATWRTASRHAA